ncbi:hypothetical protein H5410_030207 [Solanum commersonii]|uniref:Uncharacterized protein n=1 Tax=Solanum commersonii TaxID=4109 RepID=A0A9J5YFG8_SOLCO|nr:hypothetical protein H5410_030207 [Solanum commersonii]
MVIGRAGSATLDDDIVTLFQLINKFLVFCFCAELGTLRKEMHEVYYIMIKIGIEIGLMLSRLVSNN